MLSWMRWSQRRQERRELEKELLLAQIRLELSQLHLRVLDSLAVQQRAQLWELAIPLAEAVGRLDHHQQLTRKRVQVMQAQQVEMRNQQEQLLLEILQATQLSAEQQMFPLIGLPTQLPSLPSSGN
ncbi:MAG: hypothetical protein ACOYB3_02045 [Azonexus sp.]